MKRVQRTKEEKRRDLIGAFVVAAFVGVFMQFEDKIPFFSSLNDIFKIIIIAALSGCLGGLNYKLYNKFFLKK